MVLFFRRVTPVKKMKPALGIPPVAEVVNRFGFTCVADQLCHDVVLLKVLRRRQEIINASTFDLQSSGALD